MKLAKLDYEFETEPYITKPIHPMSLLYGRYTGCNRASYKPFDIVLLLYENAQVHYGKPWYIDQEKSTKGLVLHHSGLYCRYAFAGKAKEQIQEAGKYRPELLEMLNIKPMWGIDLYIEYKGSDCFTEIIHVERDYFTLKEAQTAKRNLEKVVDKTNWDERVALLLSRKDQWCGLSREDQHEYKAKFFGWHQNFDNYCPINTKKYFRTKGRTV
jgi:hypothetical protein